VRTAGAPRRRLVIADGVRADGVPHVVIGVSGTGVRLADEAGDVIPATVTGLLAEGRLDLDGARASRCGGPRREAGLEGLPEAMVGAARWWERHIAEVVYGLPPGTRPKPQYDPELHSLTAREKAKAGELAADPRRRVPPARGRGWVDGDCQVWASFSRVG
jgi:putative transposase